MKIINIIISIIIVGGIIWYAAGGHYAFYLIGFFSIFGSVLNWLVRRKK